VLIMGRGEYGRSHSAYAGYRVASDIPEGAQEVTRELDAKINNLAKTWKPSGFYDSAEIIKVVDETSKLIQRARHAVGEAPRSTGDAETSIGIALKRLDRDALQGQQFIAIARVAAITKAPAPALALKTWVLNSMNNASIAFLTAATLQGNLPWAAKAIASFQHGFDATADAIKGAGSVAYEVVKDVGEGIKDVGEGAYGALKALPTIAKAGGIAVLGVLGVWGISKLSSASRA
jgi:hypothetical protein